MPAIPRILDVRALLERKSCFLFGPRQTGKSTLIGQQFADCRTWNLLDQELFRRLARNPGLIRESLAEGSGSDIVVIDEIQRMPELLNEVHLMIEEHGARFLLTGSSARALRRKGVNLLGGRAGRRSLHPLVRAELGKRFHLGAKRYRTRPSCATCRRSAAFWTWRRWPTGHRSTSPAWGAMPTYRRRRRATTTGFCRTPCWRTRSPRSPTRGGARRSSNP